MVLVGELLERAARATPAAVEDCTTGWWFRHTDNSTWWSGAVLAHGGPSDELDSRIDAAERFYADHDAAPRFQVCRGCPPALDQSLAERGYRWEAPISVLTSVASVSARGRAPADLTVRHESSIRRDWLAVLETTGEPGTDVGQETRLLGRVERVQTYVTVLAGGEPVGIARAVADGGWTGVFNMATAPGARRRGVARRTLAALAGWADTQDASRLYLQVEQSNEAARRLYSGAGFTELSTYHYRVGAPPRPSHHHSRKDRGGDEF